MELFLDVLKDAAIDTLKLIPFLFVTYFLMELFEHKVSEKTKTHIVRSGRLGPLVGGLIGVFPQCGFSAAAASLYSGRIITAGTLIAVFLSTSDEMLPIFISTGTGIGFIIKTVIIKALIGIISGFIIDGLLHLFKKTREDRSEEEILGDLSSHHEHSALSKEPEKPEIFLESLKHTLETTIYIFICSIVIGLAVELIGTDSLSDMIINYPVIGQMITGLIGLIPNCAASVMLTEMYLSGVIGFGQMMSGLLVGAGVGILVLVRSNHNAKENIMIIAALYALGVIFGVIAGFLPV